MNLTTIVEELEALLNAPALLVEGNLAARSRALDFLRYAGEVLRSHQRLHGYDPTVEHLLLQAEHLGDELRQVNRELYGRLRQQIRSGSLSRQSLRDILDRFTPYEPRATTYVHVGLDPLDELIPGILHEGQPPKPARTLASEMVAYQPSPYSAILALVDQAAVGPGDVFYDLGSGLGNVALLVHLLTGAKARGVEIDPTLCTYARECAQSLGLTEVAFINADVRTLDVSDGTIFYLFTPFTGDILTEVMDKLKQLAGHNRIRIGSFGPITPTVAMLPWLRSLNDHQEDQFRLALLESR